MIIPSRFLLFAATSLALLAAGCVNKEPQQRAAFIQVLQSRIVQAPAGAVPALTESEGDALGDYASHYKVLGKFHEVLLAAAQVADKVLRDESVLTLADLQARHDAYRVDRDALAGAEASLRTALSDADTVRTALEQPPDLQSVYALAYDKTVTVPAAQLAGILQVAIATLDDVLKAADFVAQHRDQIVLDGPVATVQDPSVQATLNAMLQTLNGHSDAVTQARQMLQALLPSART